VNGGILFSEKLFLPIRKLLSGRCEHSDHQRHLLNPNFGGRSLFVCPKTLVVAQLLGPVFLLFLTPIHASLQRCVRKVAKLVTHAPEGVGVIVRCHIS
jgi:hypothetical protein